MMRYVKRFVLIIVALLLLSGCNESSETLTINFDTDGGTTIEQMIIDLNQNRISIPTPVKEDNTFSGWYLDDEFITTFDITTFDTTETIMLYANWTLDSPIDIVFMVGNEEFDIVTISDNSTLVFPEAPVKDLYVFGGWYLDPTYNQLVTSTYEFVNNVNLYAKYTPLNIETGVFDALYNDILETYTIEHVLVLEKYMNMGDTTDVYVLYDYKSYLITMIDIEAEVGDVISLDGIFLYQEGLPMLLAYENLTIESSNNFVIKNIVYPNIQDGLDNYGQRPFYTIMSGLCNDEDDPYLRVYFNESTATFLSLVSNVVLPKDSASTFSSVGGLYLPIIDDDFDYGLMLYDEDISVLKTATISDQDQINLLKKYYVNILEDPNVSVGDSLEPLLKNDYFDAVITYHVASGYEAYYNEELDQFAFTELDQVVVFDVTATLGNVTETFQITVHLSGWNITTISDAIASQNGDVVMFKGTVVAANSVMAIIDDGTELISISLSSDDPSPFTMEQGKEYIFMGESSYIYTYNFTMWVNVVIIAEIGDGDNFEYTIESYTWGEFPVTSAQTPYAVTLTGVFEIAEGSTTELYIVTNSPYTIIVGTPTIYNNSLDEYNGKTVTATVFLTSAGSTIINGNEVDINGAILVSIDIIE